MGTPNKCTRVYEVEPEPGQRTDRPLKVRITIIKGQFEGFQATRPIIQFREGKGYGDAVLANAPAYVFQEAYALEAAHDCRRQKHHHNRSTLFLEIFSAECVGNNGDLYLASKAYNEYRDSHSSRLELSGRFKMACIQHAKHCLVQKLNEGFFEAHPIGDFETTLGGANDEPTIWATYANLQRALDLKDEGALLLNLARRVELTALQIWHGMTEEQYEQWKDQPLGWRPLQ